VSVSADAANLKTAAQTVALEAHARTVAETHRNLERARGSLARVLETPSLARSFDRAQVYFGARIAGDVSPGRASEWFLDNYYLIRRVARQVEEELPRGFRRHLPRLASGPRTGQPRVSELARALIAKSGMLLDMAVLRRFVDAYQEVSPLTIAELWALPTMLRTAILELLLGFLDELHVPVHSGDRRAATDPSVDDGASGLPSLDAGISVELAIRVLRVLDVLDWKSFFENTNRVESILRTDPARVYAHMDFETCDSYRKVVEALAWATGTAEDAVANLAIALAHDEAADDRRGHVGYYLVAEGRVALEGRLGYRPVGVERVRRAVRSWPTASYLLPLALVTVGLLVALAVYLLGLHGRSAGRLFTIAATLVAAAVPASTVAVTVLQWAFARLLPPQTLPKLDFSRGLPIETRALVVIPTLLGRSEDVTAALRQVELHYLSNPDPQLQFALLTDDVDAAVLSETSEGRTLLDLASRGIVDLNRKHSTITRRPFHLLHRAPRWNSAEECFMGWERKRGKLEELNRLLRGDTQTSYSVHIGDPEGLHGIRFVITLDRDTELPMGAAHRLLGLLAHPLNRAVFEARTGRVIAGFTVAQPRVETSPSTSRQTLFSRLYAGDIGFDIYTHACSELYQDLFGSGIYVGKGVYDVDAFMRSLAGRTPENAIVSHDLFEGIHGRTALATDIVLFESYPSNYATYVLRMHRWLRGDWQLFPWLFPRVPSASGHVRNSLGFIDRWKIIDNLRRSLSSPSLLVLLVLGWVWSPGNAWAWTLGTLAVLVAPLLPALVTRRHGRLRVLGRGVLAVALLPYEAFVVLDAVGRVFVRKVITGRHLLQWTSAAHTAFGVNTRSLRGALWPRMIGSPLFGVGIGALTAWVRPSALVVAAPLLILWIAAPEIAIWVSRPVRPRDERITPSQERKLRLLARRTWRFFEVFVGPNDQWLPIDNYQEEPREQTAHRTSPTNIGLMLVATVSAYDFGYIGPSELSLRVRRAFDSISRLPHYQGHLFNWYDTRNLQPLLPRYVSTVDSGNYAGCLVALKHACEEVVVASVLRAEPWDGLRDSVDLLAEVVETFPKSRADPLRAVLAQILQAISLARGNPRGAYPTLRRLCDEASRELDQELLALLDVVGHQQTAERLHALRTSVARFHEHLQQIRRELDALLPWLALESEADLHGIQLPSALRLDEIPAASRRLRLELDAKEGERRRRGDESIGHEAAARKLADAFRSSEANAVALVAELTALALRAEEEMRGMDFKLLYDVERKLFRIGYNATIDQVDANHYDLLASEARLASYLAIVKHDVPKLHWYALGRPMTSVANLPLLLSWGGTMFEYLMPALLMRSQEGTLLAQTGALAVEAQIAHGKMRKEPWGVSESAYARVDADQTYQYRSFGVPGLGFRRGLEEDRVVTPYASVLAVSIRPRAVVENVAALEARGMLGTYGLFEALDFSPERVLPGQPSSIVHSYMTHHQGMLLVALGNFLNRRSMVDRFHDDALIETGEMLLNEHAPDLAPAEWPAAEAAGTVGASEAEGTPHAPGPWLPADSSGPQAFVLSNGRLTSLLTPSGGGGLRWQGLALTRYEPDATRDDGGLWFYLRDEESDEIWPATSREGRTTYAMHATVFHLRNQGISTHVDVAVAASDDAEVRLITLHNETNRVRRITVTSAGVPVLFDAKQAPTHPAFSGMFVESERVAELESLLFTRRPQTASEEPAVLVHRLVRDEFGVALAGFESDRGAFFGRGASARTPRSLIGGQEAPGRIGAVLDPIMSLTARVLLKPKGSATFAFVTAVGRTRKAVLELARKYGSMHAVRWTFRDAEQESPRRLQRAKIAPELLPTVQRLFSAMLFAHSSLRPASTVRAAAHPCQRRLWGRGISGDDPIVLVRVHDPTAPLLCEALAAQRYLRLCGEHFDLVLLDEQVSGYATEGSGTLRSVLEQDGCEEWLNRHGGIFVIAADQVQKSEIVHLEACARVVLDTRDGSLVSRLQRVVERPPKLPRFEATLVDDTTERPRPRSELRFDNDTGGFSEDGREYVLNIKTGRSTPAPWCNVLANPEFGCLVSESSLGATWSLNSGENRLTPWRNDPVLDTPSEALYLRDEETAAIWSSTALPAGQGAETLVRHGAGYTTYERESHGLVQELTVFVPPDAALKVVRLRVKNALGRHRRLTATYYAEWVLGSRREQQRPYIVSEFDRERACVLATCSWNEEFAGRVAFLASKDKVHGVTTDRTEFLGDRGDYARPEALERWGLSGRIDQGADPCAALQVHLDLAPGEETVTHFILGQASDRDAALQLIARYRDEKTVDAAWGGIHAFWDGVLGNLRVKTPEPSMDLMLNRWLLYQALSSRVFGRTAFYQSSGAFGYRDQLQDVLALLHAAPFIVRAHILEAAKHQFEEGDVLHWWHPPSGRGVRTRCSDDLAWLPYVTGEYVAATGDTAILDELVSFLHGEPLRPDEHDRYAAYEATGGPAPLFEHCRRAIERAVTEGVHGLPLMGDGDWNDGMSRVGAEGRGESVWLAWFLCATMDRFAALATHKGESAEASKWLIRAESLRAKTRDVAWDGAWYLRAFHDDGSLVGSATSRECKIDSIAQSWAALSTEKGGHQDERTRCAVRAADDQLVHEADRLALLLWPPFDATSHDPGYIRAYPPGIRENGGQYTHAAAWLGFAHAALGDGERAERLFRVLNPVLRTRTARDSARYRVEPYVLAGDVYGCAPWVGRGGWTWYTGAAAWTWRLGIEAILGLRMEGGHLTIDPCIPPSWNGFEAWARVGEQCLHVVVENPDRVATGVATMTLDGVLLDSNQVRVASSATGTREVRVRLGSVARDSRRGGATGIARGHERSPYVADGEQAIVTEARASAEPSQDG
jgi:cyclic beta-1,2-glucan synthetase